MSPEIFQKNVYQQSGEGKTGKQGECPLRDHPGMAAFGCTAEGELIGVFPFDQVKAVPAGIIVADNCITAARFEAEDIYII